MVTTKITLKAAKRTMQGRKVKRLRKEGILPVNLYGKKVKSMSLQLELKEFKHIFRQAGETQLVALQVTDEKEPRQVLIHNVQHNPVSDEYVHADLRQVLLTEKIEAEIPLIVVGTAPAVSQGGVLVKLYDTIKVEALPTDLPEKFEINVSKLEKIGDSITLKELSYDKSKVKTIEEDITKVLVKIEAPTKEEVAPVAPAAEGAAVPAEGAEGAAAPAAEGEKKEAGKPGEAKPAATKPGEKSPAGKPGETKPAAAKPAAAKPDEKKN